MDTQLWEGSPLSYSIPLGTGLMTSQPGFLSPKIKILGSGMPTVFSHKAERKSHRGALVCIGTFPHKNMPSRPQQIAVSPKFIVTEKLK